MVEKGLGMRMRSQLENSQRRLADQVMGTMGRAFLRARATMPGAR